MFKRLKRLTAIAGVGALAFAVAPTAAQAAAPGWTHTVGVKTGDTAHHGVIHGPDGANYLCAADGAAYSASAEGVTQASMQPAKAVDTVDATPFIGPGQQKRTVKVTEASKVAQFAWIASTANTTDNVKAAAYQIALIRTAGVFEGSVYQSQEQGKFPWANGQNLNAPLAESKAIVEQAQKYAGPYSVKPTLKLNAEANAGTVENIGVTSAAGNWMKGYSYTLEITGPATFDNGKTTMTGTTGESATTAKIKANGVGKVSVKMVVKDLPTSKPYVSSGTVTGSMGTQRAQNLVVLGKKEQAEGVTEAQQVAATFAPEIATQTKTVEVAKGASLVDTVTASAPKGGTWLNIPGTSTPVPVKVTVDVYGPFPTPSAPTNNGAAFAAKKVGTYDLTFNGPGTQETPGTVKAAGEGYYFFHAHVDKAAQGQYQNLVKDYSSPFFETSETSVTKWTPSIKTKATQVDLGNGKAGVQDLVTVSGFPQDHGTFKGSGKWKADTATITHKLYFLPAGTPLKPGVTKNLKPIATTETPAKNGTYTVQGKDFPINWNLGVGTYMIVSTYQGDSRTSAITTSELDKNEHVTPVFGKVTTKAFAESAAAKLKPGDKIGDTVVVQGNLPEGSYSQVNLYKWDKGTAPKCESPVWTSQRVAHSNQPGEYKTDLYTTGSEEKVSYGFVESTFDKNGNLISRGKCGASSETLTTGTVPKPGPSASPSGPGKAAPKKPPLANTGANVTMLAGIAVGFVVLGAAGIAAYNYRRKKS